MTQPGAPTSPTTVGTEPRNADDLNGVVGLHLNSFLNIRTIINQDQNWLAATDLKVEPYLFTADQETLIKSAISGLNGALQGVDLTFINRLVGPSRITP